MRNEDFFDDDGNLVKTAWQLEQERKEQQAIARRLKAEEKQREKEYQRELRDQERRRIVEERNEKIKQKQREKEFYDSMPAYMKALPKTPLDAPPTVGMLPKLKTKIKKKTVLSNKEREAREQEHQAFDEAMKRFKTIREKIPQEETLPGVVTVVSYPIASGATAVSRMLVSCMAENRSGDRSTMPHVLVDLGASERPAVTRFSNTSEPRSAIREIVKIVRGESLAKATALVDTLLVNSGRGEEFLLQAGQSFTRGTHISEEDILLVFETLLGRYSMIVNDCDTENPDALLAALSVSEAVVLVVSGLDPVTDAQEFLDLYGKDFQCPIIVACNNTHPSFWKLQEEIQGTRFASAINAAYVIGSDEEMSHASRVVRWKNTQESTKNVFREMCADITTFIREGRELES